MSLCVLAIELRGGVKAARMTHVGAGVNDAMGVRALVVGCYSAHSAPYSWAVA